MCLRIISSQVASFPVHGFDTKSAVAFASSSEQTEKAIAVQKNRSRLFDASALTSLSTPESHDNRALIYRYYLRLQGS